MAAPPSEEGGADVTRAAPLRGEAATLWGRSGPEAGSDQATSTTGTELPPASKELNFFQPPLSVSLAARSTRPWFSQASEAQLRTAETTSKLTQPSPQPADSLPWESHAEVTWSR